MQTVNRRNKQKGYKYEPAQFKSVIGYSAQCIVEHKASKINTYHQMFNLKYFSISLKKKRGYTVHMLTWSLLFCTPPMAG